MRDPSERTREQAVDSRLNSLGVRVIALTDVRLSGLSHADQVAKLIDGGATLIQLREKHLPPSHFYEEAKKALSLARLRGAKIIINDRVDIALSLGADGVHLGQDDLPPEAARALLGAGTLLGFSTHNVEQAIRGATAPLNYLAIGPIFKTTSKENPDPVVGLEGLRKVRSAVKGIPLVAIGGINHDNAREVLAAGADAVAVMSAVLVPPYDITNQMKKLVTSLAASV